ncbi:MAG: TolC family protein, partial [Taibaiella sp.]|nr:TolC family protein [Taibaiella sp.]
GARVDYLQALVDYNARQADSLAYIATFAQACDSISVLMGENEDKLYIVDDSLQVNTALKPEGKDKLADINLSLSAWHRNAHLSRINEDIARTYFLPTLNLNGGYVYNRSTSATGFALFSQNYGANGSVNLSVPLFMGGNLRRQAKVASLQSMRDGLMFEKQNTIIGRQYRTAWRNYSLAVAALRLARENIRYAKENMDVQLARFRIGLGTTLESREAENSFVLAIIRLYTAEYDVKVNETQLLELENKLVAHN